MFSPKDEKTIVEFIENINSVGGTITYQDISIIVQAFLKSNKITQLRPNVEFKASKGWVGDFLERNQLKKRIRHGEKNSSTILQPETKKKLLEDTVTPLLQYKLENIFNLDETSLFFNKRQRNTITTLDSISGFSKDTRRLTLLLGCNVTGSIKLKPLLIGKSQNPRALRNKQKKDFIYKHQKNAWMNSEIFRSYLVDHFIPELEYHNLSGPVAVIVDNFSGHYFESPINNSNIKLFYLPANITSTTQPLDQGIIYNTKQIYSKLLKEKVIFNALDSSKFFLPRLDVWEAATTIVEAWQQVCPQTILKCWRKTGLVNLPTFGEESNYEEEEDVENNIQTISFYLNTEKILLQDLYSHHITGVVNNCELYEEEVQHEVDNEVISEKETTDTSVYEGVDVQSSVSIDGADKCRVFHFHISILTDWIIDILDKFFKKMNNSQILETTEMLVRNIKGSIGAEDAIRVLPYPHLISSKH